MAYRKDKQVIRDQTGLLTHRDCPRCNQMLDVSQFSISRHYPDGISSLCRACTKKFADARDTPESRRRLLLSRIKSSAKKQNLPFDLSLEDINIPTHCPVLGIPLVFGSDNRDNSPSLDRIIPVLGYVKHNVLVVSYRANRIKNDATVDELQRVSSFYVGLTKLR